MLEQIRLPAIAHLRQLHFVVLLSISKDRVFVHDPAIGPVIYRRKHFDQLSSNHLIECRDFKSKRVQKLARPKKNGLRNQRISLFILETAKQLLLVGLLLAVSTFLFLALNQVGEFSMIKSGLGLAFLGLLVLLIRVQSSTLQARVKTLHQREFLQGCLRVFSRGRDLIGFRGRPERDVANHVKRVLEIDVPRNGQLPTVIASIAVAPLILMFLSWKIAVAWISLISVSFLFTLLGRVHKCELSVRQTSGRYTRLFAGHPIFGHVSTSEFCGEVAKWSVILVAGLGVLLGTVQPPSLVFWVLFAMQSGPTNFRLVGQLLPICEQKRGLPDLIGTVVENRIQAARKKRDIRVTESDAKIIIEEYSDLISPLQRPDLTSLEQRLVIASAVEAMVSDLSHANNDILHKIRVFGPGQEATSVDLEFCRDLVANKNVAVREEKNDVPSVIGADIQQHVARALIVCEAKDFPVFWDVHSRIEIADLAEQVLQTELSFVGHLTFDKFTIVRRAVA